MTDHPITPNRLREYAETRGDTLEGLRVDELAFLEACAWEWEKAREASAKPAWPIPDHEYGKPAAPSSPAAERASVTCAPCIEHDHEGPPEPAAESADEGLEDARVLWEAFVEGLTAEWAHVSPDSRKAWLRVARAARALRRGGVTEAMRNAVKRWREWLTDHSNEMACTIQDHRTDMVEREIAALDSGASVVVDREEWERIKRDGNPWKEGWTVAVRECDTARAEAERLRGERDEAKADNERLRSEALPRICECGHPDSKHGFYAGSHPTSCASGCACKKFTLRTAAPTVAVTDCEKAAREIGSETASYAYEMLAILRKHTRSVSVEEVASAITIEVREWPHDQCQRAASAALRALGVREAEKESLDERLKTPIQITKPGQSAEDFVREQREGEPPPAPAQAGWTEVAAESIVKMLRPHDGESRHRLNVEEVLDILRARAPKVRVKLPERLPIEPGMRPETFERRTTYNQAIEACAAAIRAAGAEIEGEPDVS